MSTSEHHLEKSHKGTIIIEEEDWGDDVSVLSRYDKASVTTIIIKIALAVVFIGACTGALIYSIITSEEQEGPVYELSDEFPIHLNQQCSNGSLRMIYRTGDDLGHDSGYKNYTYTMNWMQDNDKKRIYHRVGLNPKDWQYSYYVFENITFFQTKKRCVQMPIGYFEFLDDFGLEYIRRTKMEKLPINDYYREVGVYEGEPPNDTKINGIHPALIRGFASADIPIVYGWELFFPRSPNITLFQQEYWFPTMSDKTPNYDVFEIPDECLK
ncbi:unnamed protein product [Auanema sp. JU1783]|nr:unnamed protein product [Auanema sp. JU1783]